MENGLLVAASRQLVLRKALDVVANNVANAPTTAFKVERLGMKVAPDTEASHAVGPDRIAFVNDWALYRDFGQGGFEETGRPLDVALDGPGFLSVRLPDGTIGYTRAGGLSLNPVGELATADGAVVLNPEGEPILPPQGAVLKIDRTGAITADDEPAGALGLVEIADRAALTRRPSGVYVAPEGVVPPPAVETEIRQGFLEASNVQPISEITNLITITRSYESVTRMISNAEDQRRQALQRLARVG